MRKAIKTVKRMALLSYGKERNIPRNVKKVLKTFT